MAGLPGEATSCVCPPGRVSPRWGHSRPARTRQHRFSRRASSSPSTGVGVTRLSCGPEKRGEVSWCCLDGRLPSPGFSAGAAPHQAPARLWWERGGPPPSGDVPKLLLLAPLTGRLPTGPRQQPSQANPRTAAAPQTGSCRRGHFVARNAGTVRPCCFACVRVHVRVRVCGAGGPESVSLNCAKIHINITLTFQLSRVYNSVAFSTRPSAAHPPPLPSSRAFSSP